MKFALVVLACVLAASNAQFNRGVPYSGFRSNPGFGFNPRLNPTYQPYVAPTPPPRPIVVPEQVRVVPRVINDARAASTLRSGNEVNPDGSYSYFYETDNGIAAQAQGTPRNFGGNPPLVPDVAQGSFSWTSPEGQVVSITYVADENGYQPQGSAIPTPPPVPAQIARALEYIARNAPKI